MMRLRASTSRCVHARSFAVRRCAAALAIWLLVTSAYAEPLDSAADAARVAHPRGVVRIVNSLGKEQSVGSGSLVQRRKELGMVLTCAHLFADGVGDLCVFFEGRTPKHALLVAMDEANDLACLVVWQPVGPTVALASSVPSPGATLSSCGFGQTGQLRVNQGTCVGQATLEDGTPLGVVELSGLARQGDSGGPIFNAQNKLVGVIFGSDGKVVDGTHCGILRSFLAAHPVTPELANRITQLGKRPMRETMFAFEPRSADAVEFAVRTPILVTVRGTVRMGGQPVSYGKVHLQGSEHRVAKLDEQGRFQFARVEDGLYDLKVDAIVHNVIRRSEQAIQVTPESDRAEIELELQ